MVFEAVLEKTESGTAPKNAVSESFKAVFFRMVESTTPKKSTLLCFELWGPIFGLSYKEYSVTISSRGGLEVERWSNSSRLSLCFGGSNPAWDHDLYSE